MSKHTQGRYTNDGVLIPSIPMDIDLTIKGTGLSKKFDELLISIKEIREKIPILQEYARGDIFSKSIEEFYAQENISHLEAYVATIDNKESESDRKIKEVGVIQRKIETARELIVEVATQLDLFLNKQSLGYWLTEKKSVTLLEHISDLGGSIRFEKQNNNLPSIERIEVDGWVDYHLLRIIVDEWEYHLGVLAILPAYYKTFNPEISNAMNLPTLTYFVKKDEPIENIARDILGDLSLAPLIMAFNNLSDSDVQGADWTGRELKIPYIELGNRITESNMVFSGQNGIESFGLDLLDKLSADDYGDLLTLSYLDTFKEALDHIMMTQVGTTDDAPEYGTRLGEIIGSVDTALVKPMMGVDIKRALMRDPRVEDVPFIKVKRDSDAVVIDYEVTTVNGISEPELSSIRNQTELSNRVLAWKEQP